MDHSRFIARHVVNLPKSGIRDFFEIVAEDEGRDLARHRRAGLRHAVAHPRGRHLRARKGQDALHLQSRPDRTAPRHQQIRREELLRQLRAGKRSHHHRRRERGARPRLPRAHQSRRQGDVSPAVLRQLFSEHHARPRHRRAGADVREGQFCAHRRGAPRRVAAGLQSAHAQPAVQSHRRHLRPRADRGNREVRGGKGSDRVERRDLFRADVRGRPHEHRQHCPA